MTIPGMNGDAEPDGELPAALFTNTQRKVLVGESEPTWPRKLRQRMRERLQVGVIDGLFTALLSAEDRRRVFQPVETHGDNAVEQRIDPNELRTLQQVRGGAIRWLAFLYTGIEEAQHITIKGQPGEEVFEDGDVVTKPTYHFDFETMLKEAVEQAALQRGERVTNFELTIETEPAERDSGTPTISELKRRFENQDRSLSMDDLHTLREETDITGEEIQDWLQESL